MIPWNETRMARERYASLVAAAEQERLLRRSGLSPRPDMRRAIGDRMLSWAVSVHRHLHEIEAAQIRARQRGSI